MLFISYHRQKIRDIKLKNLMILRVRINTISCNRGPHTLNNHMVGLEGEVLNFIRRIILVVKWFSSRKVRTVSLLENFV